MPHGEKGVGPASKPRLRRPSLRRPRVAKIKIRQVRSSIGQSERHRGTLRSLGLGKIGKSVERPDDPTVEGALPSVRHLVKVED